jgi:spore germination protein KA
MKTNNLEEISASLKSKSLDFSERSIPFRDGMVKLFYISQLTDRTELATSILRPLMNACSSSRKGINAQDAMDGIIYADQCSIESDTEKIEEFILSGMTVILFSNDSRYISVNLKKVEQRQIPEPKLNYSIRGPQDCFTENLDTNLSLIRYRTKDKNIQIKYFEVGVRSKSRVAVVYIDDIANSTVVNELQKRIESINVDGVGESGELQAFLQNNKLQLFPQIGIVERSDMAFQSLIEGKVLVLIDGSGLGLLAPMTFGEFFHSSDDRYDNKFFGVFARCLRYCSISIALVLSSLYIGATSFHTDILPVEYAIILAQMRTAVPYNSFIATIILEFIIELLRESLLRIPKHIGPAIGIVGAIVIGQAAISAGLFSPLLLIIVSTSMLASFAIPDYSLMNPFRILKFGLLVFTGMMGFYGFTIFIVFILTELVSLNSFGVPYMVPWAPSNLRDLRKSAVNNVTIDQQRPEYLNTKDKTRTGNSSNTG